MGVRVEFRWPEELVARLDVASGDVPRSLWVRRLVERELESPSAASKNRLLWQLQAMGVLAPDPEAVEQALSEAQGPYTKEQADPGPVPSSEGIRSAAPAEQPPGPVADESVTPNERATVGGAAGASSGRVHLPTCRCPVCS